MQLPWHSLHRPPAHASRPAWPPTATALLLALLVAGALTQWNSRRLEGGLTDPLIVDGALTASSLKTGQVWRILTHLFLNAGPGWLLPVSLLTLALVGRPLEGVVGKRHLWQLFGLAGVAGGLGQVGFDALLGREVPVAGASSAVMGILLALAYVSPKTSLIPWPQAGALRRVKVVHGTLGALAATVVAGTHPPAAGALVGGLTGCLYMHALGFSGWCSEETTPIQKPTVSAASSASWGQGDRSRALAAPVAAKQTVATSPLAEPGEPLTSREFIAAKIDPILEKISREGLGSLTVEECQLLEQAREKVR